MVNQKTVRHIVILISLVIFCYQLKVAFDNVLSNATVDSTEYIPISDLDSPPVITVCPRQGVDDERLYELGYSYIGHLLQGNKLAICLHT